MDVVFFFLKLRKTMVIGVVDGKEERILLNSLTLILLTLMIVLIILIKTLQIKSHQNKPYLSKLLLDSPYKLYFNEYPFQTKNADIRTCGRHCCARLWARHLTDAQYHKFIKEYTKKLGVNADELVTLLTE